MPSEIAPCPVCGGAGEQNAYDRSAGQITCVGECGWAQPADVWNRLSRAAALLRAVEVLERRHTHLCAGFASSSGEWCASSDRLVGAPTLPAALIALAARLEVSNA